MIQEAWIGGVSTRRVDDLVQAMGLAGHQQEHGQQAVQGHRRARACAFLDRPLAGEWPYLWLDATYLKQREGGRIVSVAAIIAVAVNTEGKREIVGLHIGPSEAETFWSAFLKSLARRGLRGVKLVISDAHEGLKAAIRRVFGATWQRCRVHWMRNALSYVPKAPAEHGRGRAAPGVHPARSRAGQPDAAARRRPAARRNGRSSRAFIDESETDVLALPGLPRASTAARCIDEPAGTA